MNCMTYTTMAKANFRMSKKEFAASQLKSCQTTKYTCLWMQFLKISIAMRSSHLSNTIQVKGEKVFAGYIALAYPKRVRKSHICQKSKL